MEITVLKAKNSLSELLRRVELGEEVVIRRGAKGPSFRIIPAESAAKRTLEPDSRWKKKISFKDEDIWASEWTENE